MTLASKTLTPDGTLVGMGGNRFDSAQFMEDLVDEVTTVSAGGVADGSVTLAKLANLATDKLIGRSTAGTGVPEAVTCTSFGRALIDDTSVAAQCTTLGLGTGDSPAFTAVAVGASTSTDALVITATDGAKPTLTSAVGVGEITLKTGTGSIPVPTTKMIALASENATLVNAGTAVTLMIGGTTRVSCDTTGLGFFAATPVAKPTVTGSKVSGAALVSLLAQLVALGLITDGTSA